MVVHCRWEALRAFSSQSERLWGNTTLNDFSLGILFLTFWYSGRVTAFINDTGSIFWSNEVYTNISRKDLIECIADFPTLGDKSNYGSCCFLFGENINTFFRNIYVYMCINIYVYIYIHKLLFDRLVGWADTNFLLFIGKNAEQNNIINIQAYRDHFLLLKDAFCI